MSLLFGDEPEQRLFMTGPNSNELMSYDVWLKRADLTDRREDSKVQKLYRDGLCPDWARHEVCFPNVST
jgi:hypothetical protein